MAQQNTFISAPTGTFSLKEVVSVWYVSSAPPEAKGEKKPIWKNGGEDISPSQNIYYPLNARIGDLKIGGEGDQYVGAMRFEVEKTSLAKAARIELDVYVDRYSKGDPLSEEIEVRVITSTSPLANKQGKLESTWTPELMRASNPPSSKHLTTFKVKEGWNRIDVTKVVKDWTSGTANHGFMFSSPETVRKNYCVIRMTGLTVPVLQVTYPPQ